MINRIIEWSLRNRFLVACGALLLAALGFRAVYTTPVDAIPDFTENQVLVYADWMGRSPKEVEDQVTYPMSTGLQGLAGVKEVRATSMFGFSLITIIFEDKIDPYFARARVLERLNYLQRSMPAGVTPQLGPDASGLGWVYQYYLDVDPAKMTEGGFDLAQLRSLQDWYVRYPLNDLATIQIGGDFRRGALDLNGREVVGGTVVMRSGENARAVIERIKEKIAEISPGLPPGVSIKPFYDRSQLIDRTIGTLKHALFEEIILVTLTHIIFLWHFRSILIVTLPLPVSILISFLLMHPDHDRHFSHGSADHIRFVVYGLSKRPGSGARDAGGAFRLKRWGVFAVSDGIQF